MTGRSELLGSDGFRSWASEARAYEFGDWSYLRDRSGHTLGVHESGLVRVHPDGEGRTEWFADVVDDTDQGRGSRR